MKTTMSDRPELDRVIPTSIRTDRWAEEVTLRDQIQPLFAEEALATRTSAARGAFTGILLGIGMWTIIVGLVVMLHR